MSIGSAIKYVVADELKILYREAGSAENPVVLLLHGFPSSSFQYRNLIPILARKYRVIAPDLPGFGFTTVPEGYKYTFDNFAKAVGGLLDALSISQFSMYIFDYGAPTGLRLALDRPDSVTAIVTQNGNAYEEGLGDFWATIKQFWASNSSSDRESLRSSLLTYETTKFQYELGASDPSAIPPETYTLDYALISRPGNSDIQLDVLYDYRTNVAMYPAFHEYFRKSQVPLLAIWGKHDIIFVSAGAEAFKKDLPNAEVKLIDAGHFVLDVKLEDVGNSMLEFLGRVYAGR